MEFMETNFEILCVFIYRVNVSFSFNETNFIIDEGKDDTQIENDTIGEQDMYDHDEIQFFEKGLSIKYFNGFIATYILGN